MHSDESIIYTFSYALILFIDGFSVYSIVFAYVKELVKQQAEIYVYASNWFLLFFFSSLGQDGNTEA